MLQKKLKTKVVKSCEKDMKLQLYVQILGITKLKLVPLDSLPQKTYI